MKNLMLTVLIIIAFPTITSGYEFTGAKGPGSSPVVTYYLNEEGSEDVTDEWDHLHRSFEVWTEVEGTVVKTEFKGMTDVQIGRANV